MNEPQRPEFIRHTDPATGHEDVLINRAGVEALIEQRIDEWAAEGKSLDWIAAKVGAMRNRLGIGDAQAREGDR